MANTVNRGWPLPSTTRTVKEEIQHLQEVLLPFMDNDVQALFELISNAALAGHTHAISGITGLVDALAGKMPASTTFALSDLTDVVGADEAPDGYILAKVGAEYIAMAALAALGPHGHTIAQVSGLVDALADRVAYSPQTKTALEKLQALANFGGISNDQDQGAQAFASGKKINILKNTLQVWEDVGGLITPGSVTQFSWNGLADYLAVHLHYEFLPSGMANGFVFRTSRDNGLTYDAGAGDYYFHGDSVTAGAPSPIAGGSLSGIPGTASGLGGNMCTGDLEIGLFNTVQLGNYSLKTKYHTSGGFRVDDISGYVALGGARNALRIAVAGGGEFVIPKFRLRGMRG